MLAAASGLLVLVAVSLAAGVVGSRILQRHRISDVVLLLGVGLLLGPVLGILDPAPLAPALPFLAPLALALVLYEGGSLLPFADLRRHAGRGLRMTLATWLLTMGAVALVARFAAGLSWPLALLLGMAVAATGIFVVIPLLAQFRAPTGARVALTLETALGDLLSVVAVTTLASVLVLGATLEQGAVLLFVKLAVGAAGGALAAFAWTRARAFLGAADHDLPLVLAVLLVAFVAVEAVGGSGFLAALVLGLLLGNGRQAPSAASHEHQGQLVFLLRSVYFVYIGLVMSPSILTWWGLGLGALLTGVMLLARVAAVALTTRARTPEERHERLLLVAIMPRGLATVIIATIPASLGVAGAEILLELTCIVLIGCDLATSAMLLLYERRRAPAARPAEAVAVGHVLR